MTTILIVDDSKAMRMIVTRTIKQAGFEAHTFVEAANGKEAFELVRGATGAERAGRIVAIAASAVAGTLALVWPTISQYALLYAVGVASVVFAFAEVASVSTRLDARSRWLGGLAGLVTFVFGVALLASPGKSLSAVITLLGVYLLVLGGLRLVQAANAWRERRASGV